MENIDHEKRKMIVSYQKKGFAVNIVSILNSKSYRISVLMLTILFAIGIFYVTLGMRPRLDPVPDIKPVTPEKYNEWQQYVDVLQGGMYVMNLAVSDFPQGLFIIECFVWIQYDPRIFSRDTIEQFSFHRSRILEKEFIEATQVGNEIFARYRVRFETKSNLHFKYFPLDSHRIYMIWKYPKLAPGEVLITSTFSRTWFDTNAVSPNWKHGQLIATYGYLEYSLDNLNPTNKVRVPASMIFFDFERATVREALIVLVPYIILLFIVLTTLLLGLTHFQMLIVIMLSLLGVILHRTIVGSMSPMTSYFVLSDWVFWLVLIGIIVVFLVEIMNMLFFRHEMELINNIRGGVLNSLCVLFLVIWFYLLYIW